MLQEIQDILDSLRNINWRTRKGFIEKLLAYPEDSYLPVLETWLRNGDDALLRNASMEAFIALKGRALKTLIPLLGDEDTDVRIFAANLLGDIRDKAAVPALVAALNDPENNVKMASAEALGKIGDVSAVEPLSTTITSEPWVAMACIEALGEIGGDNALSVLSGCLEKEEYRGMIFAAIEKAGDQRCIGRLTPFVDREGDLRELALKAIVNIAEKTGIQPMPSYFIRLVPLLIELQKSSHTEVRRVAFIALCWSEDIRGFEYFIKALQEDELQEYGIKALISLGKKAVPGIIEELKTPGPNRVILAKILSMLGEEISLMRFADDEDAEVRTEVAIALGFLNIPKAKETLLMLGQDPVEEVRAAALISLRKYGLES